MRKHEVRQVLGALKALDMRGYVTIDEPMVDIWTTVLNQAPAVQAHDAMATVVELVSRPQAVFPKPGEFRALVAERAAGVPSVADAREQVTRALRENYPGMPPRFTPDPLVRRALKQIGGPAVFRASQSEQKTDELWRAFDAAYRRERDAVATPALGEGRS